MGAPGQTGIQRTTQWKDSQLSSGLCEILQPVVQEPPSTCLIPDFCAPAEAERSDLDHKHDIGILWLFIESPSDHRHHKLAEISVPGVLVCQAERREMKRIRRRQRNEKKISLRDL